MSYRSSSTLCESEYGASFKYFSTEVTNPQGGSISFGYDAKGNVATTSTNARGKVTTYRTAFSEAVALGGCVKYTVGLGPNVDIEAVPPSDQFCGK